MTDALSLKFDPVQTTLPRLLQVRAREAPQRIALREKVRGIWQPTTWAEYEQHVIRFARGLEALGFKRGDRLAIAAEDSPEWMYADLAAQALGGATVGIYPTNSWIEVRHLLGHSGSRIVVCGDQEQVDKVLQASADGSLPAVGNIICIDMKGLRHYADARLMSFDAVCERTLAVDEPARRQWWNDALDRLAPDDRCIIVYTSGTTGLPKGAQLRHVNLLHSADAVARLFGFDAENYSVLCYLPLCHVAERVCSMTLHLRTGGVVNFAESIDTVPRNICEIAPSFFFGVPRIWEKYRLGALIRLRDASWFQRAIFDRCFARASALLKRRNAAEASVVRTILDSCERALYWLLIFRSVVRHMGLNRSRVRMCGGASVSPETLRFFEVLGIPVYQAYGLTESGGITFTQHDAARLNGYSGQPIAGVDFRLADDGEVLIKGPTVFAGYLDDSDATRAILDEAGWLRSGDIAEAAANGEIRIVDRKKAIIITSGGKNIAPSEIENALKESPYIREAVILGEARHYLAALIQIDIETTGKWAQDRGLAYTNYRSLAALPEVDELVSHEVERVNQRFARVESIRRFVILSKELDHDDGELTATQKVKRAAIERKFAKEIAEIYGETAP